MSWTRPTKLAARIAQAITLETGVFGVFFNPLLILIAIFAYFPAKAETQRKAKCVRRSPTACAFAEVMNTSFATLRQQARAGAVELLLATSQNALPVVDKVGRFEGLMTRGGIVHAMREKSDERASAKCLASRHPHSRRSVPYRRQSTADAVFEHARRSGSIGVRRLPSGLQCAIKMGNLASLNIDFVTPPRISCSSLECP